MTPERIRSITYTVLLLIPTIWTICINLVFLILVKSEDSRIELAFDVPNRMYRLMALRARPRPVYGVQLEEKENETDE